MKAVDFANADLSANRAAGYFSTYSKAARKCRIFLDDKDEALEASRRTHSGNRLGAPHSQISQLVNTAHGNIELIDHSAISGKSHDLPFWLLSDIFSSDEISAKRKCRLQKIRESYFKVVPTNLTKR